MTLLALSARVFAAAPPPAVTATPGPNTPVARVAGTVITSAELAAEARTALSAAEARHAEELQGIRSSALDALIEKRILEAKAKKEGLTVDKLLERDVTGKVAEPTDAAVQATYDEAKTQGHTVPPFSEVKTDIARFLKQQQAQQARQTYLAGLRAEARVENLLPPYLPAKVDVKADGPIRGDAKAPVTIVEFSDYQCSFCALAEPTVKRLLDEYKGKVRVIVQSFPLPMHPSAPKAAEAAFCAGDQGKYWEMHDTLFAHQQALGVDDLKGYARTIGLDADRFDACLDSGRKAAVVDASFKLGEAIGVNSTPAFYINGRPVSGAQPFEKFKGIVDHEVSAQTR